MIRPIHADDIEAIFEVRIATWHNPRGRAELTQMGITSASVRQQLERTHRGWLCEVEGRTIGFTIGNCRTGEMRVIAVLHDFEGQGIGRRLLEHVEASLRDAGWDEIWLTTDTGETLRAVGFYRHLGWQDWKIDCGDRYMTKRLR